MKPWYQSKTIWVNLLGTVALLLHGPLGNILPAEYAALGLAVINLGLRVTTTQGLTLK